MDGPALVPTDHPGLVTWYEQTCDHEAADTPGAAEHEHDVHWTTFAASVTRWLRWAGLTKPLAAGLELPGDPGQCINVYTAPPESPSEDALNLPAS